MYKFYDNFPVASIKLKTIAPGMQQVKRILNENIGTCSYDFCGNFWRECLCVFENAKWLWVHQEQITIKIAGGMVANDVDVLNDRVLT